MNVPMVDLRAQHAPLREELDAAVLEVLRSGHYVLGPNVRAFESEIAQYLGVEYAIGCASGTDALQLALRAAGVGPGTEVITTAFSFIATAEAIAHTGATPLFVDIDPDTLTLDAAAARAALSARTAAVLPVHLYGQSADLDALRALCAEHGLMLIEDAAQAIGGEHGGRKLGGIGDLGCFSFYPSKNLGAAGDGGLVVTRDPALAERVRLLREHGHTGGYRHELLGFNSRLDEIQAAILRVKLRHLDAWNAARAENAARYGAALGASVRTPLEHPRGRHAWHQYTIRSPRRDAIRAALAESGVASTIYYPVPIHRQRSFLAENPPTLPETEAAAGEVLSLPVYPELGAERVEEISAVVRRAAGAAGG